MHTKRLICIILVFLLEFFDIDNITCIIIGYLTMYMMKRKYLILRSFVTSKVYSLIKQVIFYYIWN